MLKILKITFIVCFALQIAGTLFLATPRIAKADEDPINFNPQITIPGSDFSGNSVNSGEINPETGKFSSDLLAKYINTIYKYGIAVVGILAAIVLMAGGVLWLTSAGNDTKITQAKELIAGSVIGSIILFGAWLILNTINPELLKLKTIQLDMLTKKEFYKYCDPIKGPTNSSTALACTDGTSGQPGATIPTPKCEEGTACTKTELYCYDFDLKKQVNRYACVNPSEYICCEYENSFFHGRPCVTKYLKDGCPIEYSGTEQKLKTSYPGVVCNIEKIELHNKNIPCYAP